MKFIFITSFADIPFFGSVKKGMSDAAQQLGVTCEFVGPSGLDVPAQARLIEDAVARKYDGIVVNIFDAAGLAAAVEKAKDAGIPVIAFNIDDRKAPLSRLSAVCQNLFAAGQTLAQHVSARIIDGSQVVVTKHDDGVSALDQRANGIIAGLKDKKVDHQILITGDRDKTKNMLTALLKSNPNIKAVLCTGQSDTEGAGLAIEENLRGRDCVVAGFDLSVETLRLIKEGVVLFTIDQQPYVQGYYPVVQLYQYCRYGIIPSDINAGADVITKDRAERIMELCKLNYR